MFLYTVFFVLLLLFIGAKSDADTPIKALVLTDFHYDSEYKGFCSPESFCRMYYPWDPYTRCKANISYLRGLSEAFSLAGSIENRDLIETDLQQNINKYGQYGCDAPEDLVEAALLCASNSIKAENITNPYLFMIGDILPHVSENFNEPDKAAELIKTAVQKINSSIFGNDIEKIKNHVFPAIGNNEAIPDYKLYLKENVNDFIKKISDIYLENHWISQVESNTYRHGGYFSRIIAGTKFIVANTIYYSNVFKTDDYNNNAFFKENMCNAGSIDTNLNDPKGQFAWLQDQLAGDDLNKVLIMHVPPGTNGYGNILNSSQMSDNCSRRLMKTILQARNLNSIHIGHFHQDEFRAFFSSTDITRPIIPGFIYPSISLNNYNNPGYRIVDFNNKGQVTNYTQFYSDVSLVNFYDRHDSKDGFKIENTFKKQYTYSETYSNDDSATPEELEYCYKKAKDAILGDNTDDTGIISGKKLATLMCKIADNNDLWIKWSTNLKMLYKGKRKSYLCASGFVSEDTFNKCIKEEIIINNQQ